MSFKYALQPAANAIAEKSQNRQEFNRRDPHGLMRSDCSR
jgi:hypothetical protein